MTPNAKKGVIHDLGIDLVATAEDTQARALGRASQALAHAQMAAQARLIRILLLNHALLLLPAPRAALRTSC